jgi:hypothetical protein
MSGVVARAGTGMSPISDVVGRAGVEACTLEAALLLRAACTTISRNV